MPAPTLEALVTPVAWTDREGRILGCNPAFARWLGVSARRLDAQSIASLDAEEVRLTEQVARLGVDHEPVRLRRMRLRVPGGAERFADLALVREEDGLRIEVYPADEFPGADPA